jgi:hypothetical protein
MKRLLGRIRHRWEYTKWVLKKYDVKVWTGFIWLRLVTTGGLLWTRLETFGLHKGRWISWLAEWQSASQEGLCSMELPSPPPPGSYINQVQTVISQSFQIHCNITATLCDTLRPLACSYSELTSQIMNPSRHFCRIPWTGDRPIIRTLPTQESTTQKNADIECGRETGDYQNNSN